MKLIIRFGMRVQATKRSEKLDADRINSKIDSAALRRCGRVVLMDASLGKDLNRILSDLGQLMNRADARNKSK